jgi:hypothetical protein
MPTNNSFCGRSKSTAKGRNTTGNKGKKPEDRLNASYLGVNQGSTSNIIGREREQSTNKKEGINKSRTHTQSHH